MNLRRQRSLLRQEIQATVHMAIFVQARARHRVLAKYETTTELLATLGSKSPRLIPEKEALVQVILAEHGSRPQPLWAALLVLACYPMLGRLRARIHGASTAGDECDQLIVSSFLEAVAACSTRPTRDRAFMRLRQVTHRLVFRELRRERRVRDRIRPTPPNELRMYEEICNDEHRCAPWPEMRPDGSKQPSPVECKEQIAFLKSHAGEVLSREKLEPVIATLVHGERLRQYVERTHPLATGDEHQRLYQRIKRRHSRAMRELRKLFVEHRQAAQVASVAPAG